MAWFKVNVKSCDLAVAHATLSGAGITLGETVFGSFAWGDQPVLVRLAAVVEADGLTGAKARVREALADQECELEAIPVSGGPA